MEFKAILDCGATNHVAHVVSIPYDGTDIATIPLNPADDQVPPCTGTAPIEPNVSVYSKVEYPFPQLVKIFTEAGWCSGALIKFNAVITAAHCVYPADGNSYVRDITLVPGYSGGVDGGYGRPKGTRVIAFDGWIKEKKTSDDIAVIFFDNFPYPTLNPYGLTYYRWGCNAPNKNFYRPQYNSEYYSGEVQMDMRSMLTRCVNGMVITPRPTERGSSGSAVIDIHTRAVFGVHSSFDSRASYEAVLTKAKACLIYKYVGAYGELPCDLDK